MTASEASGAAHDPFVRVVDGIAGQYQPDRVRLAQLATEADTEVEAATVKVARQQAHLDGARRALVAAQDTAAKVRAQLDGVGDGA